VKSRFRFDSAIAAHLKTKNDLATKTMIPATSTNIMLRSTKPRFITVAWAGCVGCLIIVFMSGCQHFCRSQFSCGPVCSRVLSPFFKWAPPPFIEAHKYSLFASPRLAQSPPRRIVLVPTGMQQGQYDPPSQFADELAAEIRAAGVCEVVLPQRVSCNCTVDGILAGQFDEREIARLARTWNCDAVMFVRVNQFQGHPPLQSSITAVLVDAEESVVIFAIDGNWNTADPEIKLGFENFVAERTIDVPPSSRAVYLQSPSNLFAYVAQQMTSALKKSAGL